MTDPIDHLISLGATSVAGKLMYRQTVLGTMRNGVFQITPEGEKMLNVQDAVVVRTVKAVEVPDPVVGLPGKPAAKKGGKKAAEVVEAPEPVAPAAPAPAAPEAPQIADLDNLLG